MIILVGGLPGSGKTYFSRKLAERVNGYYISSDTLRKSLGASGKYDMYDRPLVYRELASLTESKLKETESPIIVDATFTHRSMREIFFELAKRTGVYIKCIWIYAEHKLINARMSFPRKDSEADYSVYLKIRDEAEAWDMPHLALESANDNIERMLTKAITYLLSDATA